jgi:hypothetical protein
MSVVSMEMIAKYAELRGLDITEGSELAASNIEGIKMNLEAWERGEGNPDARLTDSEETRELFAPLRAAYITAQGGNPEDPAHTYSKVSFSDPDAIIETTDGLAPVSTPVEELPVEPTV